MAGFNANDFRSAFSNGFARPNQFHVEILNNPVDPAYGRDLQFSCETAEFPGKTINTMDYKDYGSPRKIPYGAMYNEISTSFIVDSNMTQKRFFDDWHSLIVDNQGTNDVAYHSNIVATVIITQFDAQGREVYKVELQEAYPISVAQMPLSWANKDDIHRMTVDFTYRTWRRI